MGNSSIRLQELVDDARTDAELAPVLPTGGAVNTPALSIANDVLQNMISGGPNGQPMNWKWNRSISTPFFLNSWQQDYFIAGQISLGWLESCMATYWSSTAQPKPTRPVECKRDLLITSDQNSSTGKICWMQNSTMLTGTWGQASGQSVTGLSNPGSGVIYTDPSAQTSMPANPITAIKDVFGNCWTLTQYGTCGAVNPFVTNLNPVYPTLQSPATVATTVNDGSVIWTAVNPQGQGFRVNPIPSQTGPIWQINPVGQNRVKRYTALSQYLDPIPDDYYQFFKQGFFTQCFRRSPDAKVRAKFKEEWALWQESLSNAVKQGTKEMDDWGFYPGSQIMETGSGYYQQNPAYPFGPWSS